MSALRWSRRMSVAMVGMVIASGVAATMASDRREAEPKTPRPDVVLLHGLSNKHHWSEDFLAVCLRAWGSRRVFLVYLNKDAHQRQVLGEHVVEERVAITCGQDQPSAGDDSVALQAVYLHEAVTRLQRERGLSPRLSIIAHSMGGLVARRFVAEHPDVVTGLVTLGTPHRGSPLASDFGWMGLFLGAEDAIADLDPERCATFNAAHPPSIAPFAEGGRLLTIRGGTKAGGVGAMGEVALGARILELGHGLTSDGLVPQDSATIDGGTHLADFPDLDHLGLVLSPEVAETAAAALP